ncbi:Uncharacterised protein [Mycobacteroides abscessus subsp. abscessus]|nr:Uncharacterised protein [Mycobacteroides abscessus subsp. abscessus]
MIRRQQRRGDQRSESTGQYRADLITQRGSAVSHPGIEELGEPGRLWTVHGIMNNVDTEHN